MSIFRTDINNNERLISLFGGHTLTCIWKNSSSAMLKLLKGHSHGAATAGVKVDIEPTRSAGPDRPGRPDHIIPDAPGCALYTLCSTSMH